MKLQRAVEQLLTMRKKRARDELTRVERDFLESIKKTQKKLEEKKEQR